MQQRLTVGDLRKALEGVDDALPVVLVTENLDYDYSFFHIHRDPVVEAGVRECFLAPQGHYVEVDDPPNTKTPVTTFCIGQCSIDAISRPETYDDLPDEEGDGE